MKKNRLLLLVLLPLISGCSCSALSTATFKWDEYRNDDVAIFLESSKFKNYKLEDFSSLNSKLEKVKKIVTDKGSVSSFVASYNVINASLIKLMDSYKIANTKFYATNSAEYQEKAGNYYSTFVNTRKFLVNLEEDIYYSSNDIKEAYFGNLTDEAIQKRLQENQEDSIASDYDVIFSQYKDEGNQLYLKYTKDGNKSYFLDKGFDYFLRYINKANELVDQLSSNNYLDYAYVSDYSRDYKFGDTLPFINYVKQYFVPIVKNKKSLNQPTNVDSQLLKVISSYNFCHNGADMCDLFASYSEDIGGRYLDAYNEAFKSGYYCFSNNADSMGTAYEWNLNGVNDGILFFSRRYQDVLSVIHEFGHYYSCIKGGRKADAYDLQETYSQSNEFTFCKYLLEKKAEDEKASTYNFYVDNKIYGSVQQIINEAVITEIENFAYTTPNLTKESLIEGVNDILATYDGAASDTYYMAACLTSPCYYVSYATSLMEALQFAALPSFDVAKGQYVNLCEAARGNSIVETWKKAGLTSPFEEKTFQTLSNMFLEIANKY
ncbi:MAG: hypothetical protein K6E21_06260 [Bacilli bacterium]|nr:hypothetical protein [Bacilli bacterium]